LCARTKLHLEKWGISRCPFEGLRSVRRATAVVSWSRRRAENERQIAFAYFFFAAARFFAGFLAADFFGAFFAVFRMAVLANVLLLGPSSPNRLAPIF